MSFCKPTYQPESSRKKFPNRVTAAKRIIAHMDMDELKQMAAYMKERERTLYRRQAELKIAAKWEKIKVLGLGGELSVWATTNHAHIVQRGDVFKIESFSPRGRKCARLRCAKNGKLYNFSPKAIDYYDLRPAAEGDPIEQPITSMIF
jgi:hypothetical protein